MRGLKDMGQYSDKILVTGHKNPDTDSITSAITYSNFKNKLEGTDKYAAMRLGNVSDETRYVLDYFNVAEPTLIEAPLEEGDKVILVDHNEKSQTVDGIENAEVLEIIDHHRLGSLETVSPVYFRNQPLGCTSTIIYQMYREQNVEINKTIAGLLCSAILSDTLMYRSPTCTPLDKAVAEELAGIAGINTEEHAKAMFQAGSDFGSKTPEEIFYQDFKTFSQNGVDFGVGQISAMTQDELDQVRDKLLPYLREAMTERKIEMVFVMLTNIIEETTYLICEGEHADELVEKAFPVHKEGAYHVLRGVVSRKKQLIPMFMSAMQDQ